MSWESWMKDKMNKRKYKHRDAAIPDALNALRQFTDLKPELDRLVAPDGKQNELVCFRGTIPVRYKGFVYNIPIKIWLLETHPFIPPLVFVTPTSSMVIKPGKHVDNVGRVYLPYLTDWRSPSSDLNGLIQVLCMIFGDDPPVYSRNSQPPSRPPQPRVGQPQTSYYGSQPPPQPQQTPYPVSQPGGGMPMPGAQSGGGYGGPSSLPYPSSGARPPSYTSSSQSPYPTSSAGYQAQTAPYPTSSSSAQPPYPTAANAISTSGYPPYSTSNSQVPVATRAQEAPTQSSFEARSGPERQGSVLDPQVLKASLLSSVEDKLKRRTKEVFAEAKRELDDLQGTNDELKARKQQLEKIMNNLKQEEIVALKNVELLNNKNKEMTDVIDKLEDNAANMKIDEAVVTTAPLYNQILNTFAEENAVEDAIYYLSEALRREVIDLDTFLKTHPIQDYLHYKSYFTCINCQKKTLNTVRSLSRKQFILRAQLKKARNVAGLREMSLH
eukprot:gene12934-14264_t